MNEKLNCIMLVDDNPHDNFFHERAIKKNNAENIVIAKTSAQDALEYLETDKRPHSQLIFLDINMPGMNGWDFLKAYSELDKELQAHAIIIMLTTSENSGDIAKAKEWGFVSDYISKPLTSEMMKEISEKYFKK